MTFYACCKHCEHDGSFVPDQHTRPCAEGCNDERGESADIAYAKLHPDPYRDWVNGEPPAPGGAR